ncbi:MAG TPA: AraC family ligand binding domain-containing protein [Firmicutes bacterium]|nr:AraC family ligand binding domain-containing protein [Bacillota bacterium]
MDNQTVRLPFPEYDQISGVGYLHQKSVGETFSLHCHDFYEIFYVPSGKAIHHINGYSEIITAGTLEFIRPDDTHRYSFLNRYDMELISIGIEKSMMEEILLYLDLQIEHLLDGNMPGKTVFSGISEMEIRHLITSIGQKAPGSERKIYAKALMPLLLHTVYNEEKTENRFIPQ